MDAGHSLKIENTPVTLRELALAKVRQAIISGYFKAGDRLVERSLCDELGVSRTVVREVIRYLEAEGLIENLPKKGPIVAILTWDVAEQIYDIRMLLESEAAKDCAKIATSSDKKTCIKDYCASLKPRTIMMTSNALKRLRLSMKRCFPLQNIILRGKSCNG